MFDRAGLRSAPFRESLLQSIWASIGGSESLASPKVALVPGITNRYCGPSFETATEPVIGRAFARPVGDLLRMRSNSLKHNNLMLRSERRERLEAWAASDSQI